MVFSRNKVFWVEITHVSWSYTPSRNCVHIAQSMVGWKMYYRNAKSIMTIMNITSSIYADTKVLL